MEYQSARKKYRELRKIDGWFAEEAAMLLSLLNAVQKQNKIGGDLFEIGVHHGKSTLFFYHFLDEGEQLRVCDLFGNQTDNVSFSGSGNKQKFLDNCAKYIDNESIPIFEKLSCELSIEEIGASYRMFHVDGGHSFEEALFDLKLAAQSIREEGIIILDDPFRSEWPGVTEALIEFLRKSPQFSALVVGFNKLILVRNTHLETYSAVLDDVANRTKHGLGFPWAYKTMSLAGKDLRCFYMPTSLQNPSLKLRAYSFLKRRGLK
ncbi:class I SAM-dependent methyltransferase [Persicitalea sp.]|uniref:class I SAM-dependent methyltransferase n=1 Tax=Persicitalea sp. TaxID=3100273 RepID=UPI003592FE05